MQFRNFNQIYTTQIATIAHEHYLKQVVQTSDLQELTYTSLYQYICNSIVECDGVVCTENDTVVGYLLYNIHWKAEDTHHYIFPVWGYGVKEIEGMERTKIISQLFQYLAGKLVKKQKVHLEISLYSDDTEMLHVFSLLQFGIQCEHSIRRIKALGMDDIAPMSQRITFRELSKVEMEQQWTEIWCLLNQLVNHLKQTPVFYAGKEFTEDVYQEFFQDEGTRVFVAEEDDKIIGVMEANIGVDEFVTEQVECYNVGDIFVLPEYRGKNVAQGLLHFLSQVLQREGCKKLWVEHGTANPNARGFWNKYFETYSYTLIRDIEPIERYEF